MKKKLSILFAVFALVLGFNFFAANSALALSDNYICETGENNSTDAPKDCDGVCQRGENAYNVTNPSPDCLGSCDLGEEADSPDCNEVCEGQEDECSADCDQLGQCAFGSETQLTSQDLRTVVARVINIILGLLGTIAVIIIIIGGFKWMTAGGNEDKVGESKKLMAAGVIGLAIVLAAYSIASFVVRGLTEATEE